jgi:hypothetical protein
MKREHNLALLKITDYEAIKALPAKVCPDWKKTLLDTLRCHCYADSGLLWKDLLENFTVSDVLSIVGSTYTIESWKKRLFTVLWERQTAITQATACALAPALVDLDWNSGDFTIKLDGMV